MVWFSRLYLFLFLFYSPFYLLSSLSTSSPTSPLCHPDDTSALLQFKNSLSISKLDCGRYRYMLIGDASRPCQTMSWKNGTDCCRWDGVTCDDITGHVIGLNLTAAGLNGIIQSNSSLFRLAHLKSLVLSDNNFNRSQISSEFVAPEISYLSKLHTINLSANFDLILEASTLKRIFENTTNLTELSLSYLDMSSIALISLMNLSSSLASLGLSYSRLQGKFPEGIFRRPNLQALYLGHLPEICTNKSTKLCFPSNSSNDQLEVSLPLYLETLVLYHNLLNGSIPTWLYSLPSLKVLYLAMNQFTGSINEFHSCSLELLFLNQNRLHGHIPRSLFQQVNLRYLDLSSNSLSGVVGFDQFSKLNKSSCRTREFPISDNQLQGLVSIPPSLIFFSMSNNQLTGNIPSQICNVSSLEVLDLSNNTLNGSLPRCLGNFSENLLVLDLRNNRLQGMIPIFAKLKYLRILNFDDNQLEGSLPQSLLTCKELEVLNVGNNKINGLFPNWLESLPELQVLILRSNRFYGPVGDPTARFPFQKFFFSF
ncbi:hypothetical protein UlMin_003588 [Ulmus minor]